MLQRAEKGSQSIIIEIPLPFPPICPSSFPQIPSRNSHALPHRFVGSSDLWTDTKLLLIGGVQMGDSGGGGGLLDALWGCRRRRRQKSMEKEADGHGLGMSFSLGQSMFFLLIIISNAFCVALGGDRCVAGWLAGHPAISSRVAGSSEEAANRKCQRLMMDTPIKGGTGRGSRHNSSRIKLKGTRAQNPDFDPSLCSLS
jgi:hypothetical protein